MTSQIKSSGSIKMSAFTDVKAYKMTVIRFILLICLLLIITGCSDESIRSSAHTVTVPVPEAKNWGPVVNISGFTGITGMANVTVDATGNAIAIWSQFNGTSYNIHAAHYSFALGNWSATTCIDSSSTTDAVAPKVLFDSAGNATAVWRDLVMGNYRTWTSRYSAASGAWGKPTAVPTITSPYGTLPVIAMDSKGNILSVWVLCDTTKTDIWSSRYSATTETWSPPALVNTDATGGYVYSLRALFDQAGNVMVTWYQTDFIHAAVRSIRYTTDTASWEISQVSTTINDSGGDYIPEPHIAVDSAGNYIAVWFQFAGLRYDVWSNRFSSSTGTWENAALIEHDDAGDALDPRVAIDASGNAIVVWSQNQLGNIAPTIWSKRYSASTDSWGNAERIEHSNGREFWGPKIAVDADGNAFALWQGYDGSHTNVYINRYTVSTGTWGISEAFENSTAVAALPDVASNPSGISAVVWREYSANVYSTMARIYR